MNCITTLSHALSYLQKVRDSGDENTNNDRVRENELGFSAVLRPEFRLTHGIGFIKLRAKVENSPHAESRAKMREALNESRGRECRRKEKNQSRPRGSVKEHKQRPQHNRARGAEPAHTLAVLYFQFPDIAPAGNVLRCVLSIHSMSITNGINMFFFV